ncbi:MAG TPA: TRAM domain-containing protein [Pseudonocardiaceae bacterium]|jgi:tRNA/tmRNA/rRNA uracil-C5-methylase (TrmA/RlmC/RlmD family)|nr:TRAM domain-containing protein [Pseudonocardiaceae bacterium]
MAEPVTQNWVGRRIEIEVGPVAHGGHCVARSGGRVVFVRHALPGEQVVVEVTEDNGGSFCRADAVRIITPSPDRVDAPCTVARPGGCGGCDWQHAAPAAQRTLKATVVAEQLQRLAGIEWDVVVEELPGGPLGWRTRERLAVSPEDGRAGLRAHRSHRVVPLADCPIAVPGLLSGVLDRQWPAGVEVEAVQDDDGGQHVARRDPVPGTRRWRTHWVTGGTAVQHAAGRTWRLRADGFWQVHPAAADTFAGVVARWADTPVGGRAWDLYGGVGLFAAVLAAQVGETGSVWHVESARSAAADAEANLADLPQVTCVADRVERAVITGGGGDPDVVVLDPPRKGAGRVVVDAIARRDPVRVVYVACDPAALARDLATFAGHGYRLADLRAFDAFPMTHHVECVALLTR